MEELIYTSAASGLEPGTSGYCTVAKTKSLPAAIARLLESLSAHRAGQSEDRRTRFHVITKLGPRRLHTLSSIVSSGLDYSGRPNKLAHHVLIDSSEVTAGPVQLLTSRELHTTTWSGQPRHLDTRSPPVPKRKSKGKSLWKKLLGDEVWLHYLSERVVAGQTTYLVYPESVEVLPLLFELEQKFDDPWQLTFSTNYAAMPPDVQCLVRCVPADDAGTLRLHSRSATEVLDLTNPQLPPARSYEAVEISFPPKPPPLERTLEETVQTNLEPVTEAPPPLPTLEAASSLKESKSWELMPILLVGGLLTAFGLIAFGAKSNKEAQEAIGRKTDVVAIATDEIVSEASRDEQTEAKFQKVFDACELDENGIVVLPETIDFDESFRLKNVEFWSGEDLVADDRAIDASATFMDDEFLGVLLKNVDGSLQLECVVQMLFPDSELNYSEQQTKAERLETQQQCLEGLLDCVKEFEETPSEDSELKALILDDWKRLLESRAGQELIVGIRIPRVRDLRQQPVSVAINGQRATGATRPRIEYKKLSLTENLDKSKEWLDNRLRKLKQEVTWADKNIAEFNKDATVLQKPGIRLEFELVRFEEGGAEIPVAQFRDTP